LALGIVEFVPQFEAVAQAPCPVPNRAILLRPAALLCRAAQMLRQPRR
jgi:hypothetical protein